MKLKHAAGCPKKRNGNSTGCRASYTCMAKQFNFYLGRKLFSFSMILFLNRNDVASRNHILPPLGIAWKTKHRPFPRGN